MRLHTQISVLLGALVLLMGVFTMLYFPAQREAAALGSLEQKAVTNSAIIARAAAAALDFYSIDSVGGNAELQTVLRIAKEDSDVAYLGIFDQDGEALPVHFGMFEDSVSFSDRITVQTMIDSRMLHILMPVRITDPDISARPALVADAGRELVGAIQMGFSLDRMQAQIRHDRTITVWVVVVMVVCAVLMAFLLSNMLMRPLEALERVVFAFGQGDENVRAQAEGPHEIRRLGAVFNHMADALEKSSQAEREKAAELMRANEAKADVEKRFRRAFENAPIGMALLDAEGRIFDANPALKVMFWQASDAVQDVRLTEMMDDKDSDRFEALYSKLISSELDSLNDHFKCRNAAGETLHTVVNLSAVRSGTDDFLYCVLQIQDVTESLKLTDRLEYQASYDELTGLLNRRSFGLELARAWQQGGGEKTSGYLLCIDLDQFKIVNDTSGHAAGDQLLRRVAEILLDNVRDNDTVCRLGGDEFGIILWKCPSDVATKIAESIRTNVETFRFHWETEIYHVGVSIGGLPIDPAVGDVGELQQLADAACYAAKEAGRNRVHMVAGEKDSARVHRRQVRWVQRLREAMDSNRFAIYGQVMKPLADDADEPEHVEILLRLRDPLSRKMIPPGAFLPAAERYGMSLELDQWVVRKLLDTVFIHQSCQAEHREYWINLSGMSIGDSQFASYLTDAIGSSRLPRGTVNFEITETAAMRSVSEARKLMLTLRDMGCRFALDDFGSGLSSFGYLKEFPVDYLKIDGMFVRDLLSDETNRIFVKSIIDIAHALNIKTIAEFVENNEILEVVRNLGADYAQGFAIGRPIALAPQLRQSSDTDTDATPAVFRKTAG